MKKIKVFICSVILLILIGITNTSIAMSHYQTVGTSTGLVTASTLNVRQGPGTKFNIVTRVNKNEYIRIFAKIGDWYVVQTDNNYIGTASSKYIKLINE